MEQQDLEQSPVHGHPTACSEPPPAHRDDAFKDLLLHISQEMSHEDTSALAFTANRGTTIASGNLSALDVLQMLVRRGEFSARTCDKLGEDLRRIKRCDLAELVREYVEKYPELPSEQRHTLVQQNGVHQNQQQLEGAATLSIHQEQSVDIGSELHVTSSGGIVVHSTPIKRQPNSSPDLGHELFLPVSHQPHQTPLPPSTSLYDSSDPFPVGIPHHHERVHSLEQSTSAQVEDYQSPFHNSHPNSNLQWGGQEGYDHPSRSANLSRDSSSYSLSSSTSQLSRTSMKLATQLISTSMNVLAHQLQQDQWYHSASTSTTSIPRPPHSDTSSMYSDAGALNQDPWAKKQSHSFHGRHSSSTHQVKMRRTPSVPARNRDFIHRSLACSAPSHPATEFTDTSLDVETGAEDIGDGFPTHTPDEDPITMKQLEHQAPPTRHLDGQNDFDSTPRQSVAADSRRQSTVSDATIKRVSVTSEATSDTTVVSPRTSVYGKDAVQPDVAEEVGELQKPMTSPPPPREKPKLQRRFSFFRSKSRSNLSSPSFTWKVVREDLIKPIWRHHTQANITRANKLELEANQGKHNPKLTFQLFPYGLHQDKGNAVTMAVRVATPDKCPPLPLSSEIQLRLSVFDVEGKEVKKSQSDTEKLSKISIFYVYTVITHNQLKESKSKYFNLEMDLTCSGLT